MGLWRLKEGEIKKGEFILFCPANNIISRQAKDRGIFSTGFCPGNLRPLIKKIVAVNGDHVKISNHVEVNGTTIHKSHLLGFDSLGNYTMKAFLFKKLNKQELFVLGTSENSFDSRYFGSISVSQAIGMVFPILTW